MSRINYTPISSRENRDAARLNAIYAEAETALGVGAINARNFAEQGLDRDVINGTVSLPMAEVTDTTRTNIAAAGAFAQLAMGAPLRTGVIGAVGADEALRFRYRVAFETTLATAHGIPAGVTDLRIRVAWNDGAATTKVTASERPLVPNTTHNRHGCVMGEGWLFGTIANVAWAELQYLLVGATANPGYAGLWVTKFRRINRVT